MHDYSKIPKLSIARVALGMRPEGIGESFTARKKMAFWSTEKKKEIAEESYKTRKAREKLRKMLEEHQSKITPQALEKKTIEIQRRIARHASNRVVLRNKSISLFDENQNAAQLSQKVAVFAEQIKKDIQVQAGNVEPSSKMKKPKKWIFTSDVKKEEK